MALKVEYRGGTTSDLSDKPSLCWTCKTRKSGLFGVDGNGNPRCADCASAAGKPIPGSNKR